MRYSIVLLCFFAVIAPQVHAAEPWGKADYTIQATLHDSTHTITAHQQVTYYNRSPHELNDLQWTLLPNAANGTETHLARESRRIRMRGLFYAKKDDYGSLKVSNVSLAGSAAELEVDPENPDLASLALTTPLRPGDSITVEMDFTLRVPNQGLMRMERRGSNYYISQWYPKLAVYDERGWNPYTYLEMGEFYAEFGDYDVTITVPEKYIVAATGMPTGESELARMDSLSMVADRIYAFEEKKEFKKAAEQYADSLKEIKATGTRTVHYTAKSVIDFAWFASKDFMVQVSTVTLPESGREVRCETYVHPSNAWVYRDAVQYVENTILFNSREYGEYPHPKAAVVDQGSSNGGMEYPMITLVGSFPSTGIEEEVIVHEVTHNWFFSIVANDQREWPWLDEAMTVYSTRRYFQHFYPEGRNFFEGKLEDIGLRVDVNAYNQILMHLVSEIGYQAPTTMRAEEYPNLLTYSAMIYDRGSLGLEYLRHYVGEERFDDAIRDYVRNEWMSHPTPEDFITSLEKSTGMDLRWFFDDYLDVALQPDYSVDVEKVRSEGDGWQVVYAVEEPNDSPLPVDVRFEGTDGESEVVWLDPDRFDKEQTISLPFKPSRVVVDPLRFTGDGDLRNNYSRRPFRFSMPMHMPDPQYHEVFLMPWANYQFAEGLILGGRVRNSLFFPGHPDFTAVAGYGFVSGDGNVRAKLASKPIFHNHTMRGMYELSGMDWAGFRQLKAGIGIKLFPLFKEDTHTHRIELWTHLNHVADYSKFDRSLWSNGKHANAQLRYIWRYRPLFSRIDLGVKLTQGLAVNGGEDEYSKADLSLRYMKILNRKYQLNFRAFYGRMLDDSSLPKQQYYYASGGVDPNFNEPTLPDRTGATWFSHSRNFVSSTYTLVRGYTGLYADKSAAVTSLELRHGSFGFFGDAGRFDTNLADGEWVESVGVTFDSGLFQLHLPLWISDPISGSSWISLDNARNRFYLSLSLSAVYFGVRV